jgi:integrase
MSLAKCWEAYKRDVLPRVVDQRRIEGVVKKWLARTAGRPLPDYTFWRRSRGLNWARLFAERADEVKPATVQRELNVIRSVLKHGVRAKVIRKMPDLPQAQAVDAAAEGLNGLTLKQIIKRSKACPELEAFVKIAINTGARPGAILDLTWDRVDFSRNIIDFTNPGLSKQRRRKKRAIVPMNKDLTDYLGRKYTSLETQLAPYDGGRVIPHCKLNALWRKHIKISRPHALRHTVATEVARRFGLLAAANLLGHKSVKTTESVYVHIKADHLRDAVDALSQGSPCGGNNDELD